MIAPVRAVVRVVTSSTTSCTIMSAHKNVNFLSSILTKPSIREDGSAARVAAPVLNEVTALSKVLSAVVMASRFTGEADATTAKVRAMRVLESCIFRDVRFGRELARGRLARERELEPMV